MIQSEANGTVLFYIDASGVKHARFYLEGKAFNDLMDIQSAQRAAADLNRKEVENYTQTIANMQISVDAGRLVGAVPAKPLQKLVSDTGEVTFVPFVPALPDLHIPPATAPKPPVIVVPVSEQIASQQQNMFNMLLLITPKILAIHAKLFPEA